MLQTRQYERRILVSVKFHYVNNQHASVRSECGLNLHFGKCGVEWQIARAKTCSALDRHGPAPTQASYGEGKEPARTKGPALAAAELTALPVQLPDARGLC